MLRFLSLPFSVFLPQQRPAYLEHHALSYHYLHVEDKACPSYRPRVALRGRADLRRRSEEEGCCASFAISRSPNFSSGLQVGDTLYVSGMTGNKDGKIPASFEDEVRQTLENIHGTLQAAGMDYSDVVAVTVDPTHMDLFQRMQRLRTRASSRNPARREPRWE